LTHQVRMNVVDMAVIWTEYNNNDTHLTAISRTIRVRWQQNAIILDFIGAGMLVVEQSIMEETKLH